MITFKELSRGFIITLKTPSRDWHTAGTTREQALDRLIFDLTKADRRKGAAVAIRIANLEALRAGLTEAIELKAEVAKVEGENE